MTACLIASVLALALSSALAIVAFAQGRRLRRVDVLRRMLAWRVCDLEARVGLAAPADAAEEVKH